MNKENEISRNMNPEAAFQSDVLRQARLRERRSAIAMCICCVVLLIGTVPLLVTSLFTHSPLPLQALLLLGAMALAGVVGLATGLRGLRGSTLPVTTREIHQSRRQTREESE